MLTINMVGILGKKLGMTEVFDEKGRVCPVTLVEAGPCFVNRVFTTPTVQILELGFQRRKKLPVTGSLTNRFGVGSTGRSRRKKRNQSDFVFLASFPFSGEKKWQKGEKVLVTVLGKAKRVHICGLTKGRGFSGVVKRHGFSGGPKTHGHRHVLRTLGSVGMCSYPGEVARGKKMPGRFGHTRTTIRDLEVVRIELEKNLLIVKGGIPGKNGSVVRIFAKEEITSQEAVSEKKKVAKESKEILLESSLQQKETVKPSQS